MLKKVWPLGRGTVSVSGNDIVVEYRITGAPARFACPFSDPGTFLAEHRAVRTKSRNSRIGGGGTNEGRTSPCSTNWAIHAESTTSSPN